MKDLAVVPVKGLAEAKKRLAASLNHEERKRLVLAMLNDVLHALHRSGIFSQVLVISPDESLETEAYRNQASFLQQNGSGLNRAIAQATKLAVQSGPASLTTVLADLPLVEPRDFEELASLSKIRPRVVLSPSLKGGTNVMMLSPPDVIPSAYGRWSYARHLRVAQQNGLPTYSLSNQRLSFDLDTLEDLKTLGRLDPMGRTNAGKLARELTRQSPLARNS